MAKRNFYCITEVNCGHNCFAALPCDAPEISRSDYGHFQSLASNSMFVRQWATSFKMKTRLDQYRTFIGFPIFHF